MLLSPSQRHHAALIQIDPREQLAAFAGYFFAVCSV
jgi:hypothetical protein